MSFNRIRRDTLNEVGDRTMSTGSPITNNALRQRLIDLPRGPGVYIFRDDTGTVIYIGKAKVLSSRVRSYFQNSYDDGREQIHALVRKIADFEVISTQTETEALVLEATLVKMHYPKYNVKLKDDKKYPWLVITNDDFPRIEITRKLNRKTGRYFGPYTDVRALRRTVELLHRIFPLRTCQPPLPSATITRPCLQYEIKRCKAPCVGLQSKEDYAEIVNQAERFIRGQVTSIVRDLHEQMEQAASNLRYETAAELRDRLNDIESMRERQNLADPHGGDRDVIALVRDDTEAVAVVLEIREGKLIGRKHHSLTVGLDEPVETILGAFLLQFYLDGIAVPGEIDVMIEPGDADILAEWLTELRVAHGPNASKTVLHVPQRGDRAHLVEMARKNAEMLLFERRAQREKNKDRIPHAVVALQRDLRMKKPPRRIVCFDISHTQGTDVVGSLVVFKDGRPHRSSYRKYAVKTLSGEVLESDDFASMREVIGRYFRHLAESEDEPRPDLTIVDGGKGQLSSAVEIMNSLGFGDLPVIGLAKRLEEVFVPGNSDPQNVPRTSSGLKLLQQLRDEAHRVAITYHRQKRGKSMQQSALDDLPGVGKARKRDLLKRFRSVTNLVAASEQDIANVPGIGPKLARTIHQHLNGDEGQ
jgi:excinuclease ABC subunit C